MVGGESGVFEGGKKRGKRLRGFDCVAAEFILKKGVIDCVLNVAILVDWGIVIIYLQVVV